jgi:hypothetical protein
MYGTRVAPENVVQQGGALAQLRNDRAGFGLELHGGVAALDRAGSVRISRSMINIVVRRSGPVLVIEFSRNERCARIAFPGPPVPRIEEVPLERVAEFLPVVCATDEVLARECPKFDTSCACENRERAWVALEEYVAAPGDDTAREFAAACSELHVGAG